MLGTRWVHVVALLLTISARAFAFADFTADKTVLPERSTGTGGLPVEFDPVILTNLTGSPLNLTVTVETDVDENWLQAFWDPQPIPANGSSTLWIQANPQFMDPLPFGAKYHGR